MFDPILESLKSPSLKYTVWSLPPDSIASITIYHSKKDHLGTVKLYGGRPVYTHTNKHMCAGAPGGGPVAHLEGLSGELVHGGVVVVGEQEGQLEGRDLQLVGLAVGQGVERLQGARALREDPPQLAAVVLGTVELLKRGIARQQLREGK